MAKARILIADTDMNYIAPIQQKFAEEYFEKVDLEIISERNYYEHFFASPQKADILIVAEELYTPMLQRHNITNIFVMTEQYSQNKTENLQISQIYKYTNINDIFNDIVGKSAISLKGLNAVKKETQIILVDSGCGGVGKTTIALGISACLNKNNKKVLYMNASRLHTFQNMLSDMSAVTSMEVYTKLVQSPDNIYSEIRHILRNEGFSYLPPFRAALMSLGIEYSIFQRIAVSAKEAGEFEYIIIDADTVFDADKASLMDVADRIIIVTGQSKAAVYATNVLASNINGAYSEKYIYICNDFDEDKQNFLISPDILKKFSVAEYVGHFPHYEQFKASALVDVSDIKKIAYLVE